MAVPFRANDHSYAFFSVAGDARTSSINNAFLASLTGPGMLRIHTDHWLNYVMPGNLKTTADPTMLLVSMRLIIAGVGY